jgi:hypothetical protein
VLTETTPGVTTTGFLIPVSTACEIVVSGGSYPCSVSDAANSFIIDVTSVHIL